MCFYEYHKNCCCHSFNALRPLNLTSRHPGGGKKQTNLSHSHARVHLYFLTAFECITLYHIILQTTAQLITLHSLITTNLSSRLMPQIFVCVCVLEEALANNSDFCLCNVTDTLKCNVQKSKPLRSLMHCERIAYFACQMLIERFREVHVAKPKAKVTSEE